MPNKHELISENMPRRKNRFRSRVPARGKTFTGSSFIMIKKLVVPLCLSLLVCALCALCACHSKAPANVAVNKFNATPVVEGFVVKPSVVVDEISISGTLMPFEETVLMPDVAGRVVAINLPEGKLVKQGTLVVKLFDEDLQASLKKSQTQLDIAEQTQKRQSEL